MEEEKETCDYCNNEGELRIIDVFQPFEEKSEELKLCEECETDMDYIFFCEQCCRYIFETNGLRNNQKYINREVICVKCYQEICFKQGMPRQNEKNLDGDFFDDSDLIKNGFTKIKSYSYGLLMYGYKDHSDIDLCRSKFNEFFDLGRKCIICIDMSGMGMGGYFSLWVKGDQNEQTK